jgi:HSP20 family protein
MALLPVRRRERERGQLTRLHNEMGDLISSFFSDWDQPLFGYRHWPAIDIAENEDDFVIKVEVPGCKADEIDISVHGNTLTISGEKKQEEQKEGKGCYHIERSYGSFRRDLNLATDVDPEKIEATCKDGVITIKVPKTEKAKSVKVKVRER